MNCLKPGKNRWQGMLGIAFFKLIFHFVHFSAQNIHTEGDWDIIFTLLECVGAGAIVADYEESLTLTQVYQGMYRNSTVRLTYHIFIVFITFIQEQNQKVH